MPTRLKDCLQNLGRFRQTIDDQNTLSALNHDACLPCWRSLTKPPHDSLSFVITAVWQKVRDGNEASQSCQNEFDLVGVRANRRTMTMFIAFDCERCGTNYKVDESRAGQSAKCRNCSAMLRVPVPPPPVEFTESGVPVMRHTERTKPFEFAPGDSDNIEAIGRHIEQFIGPVPMVFHELVSDLVHIDVHHVPPNPGRDFHTLITSGMSDRPMTVPEGAKDFQFAELLLCLPADWQLTRTAFADEKNYWPIRLLKVLARLPHEYDTWLGIGHTVPNGGEEPQPYADNTKFCCAMIVPPLKFAPEFRQLELDDRVINFYSVWPLLPDETEFKLKQGFDPLVERLLARGVSEVIDITRPSACRRKWWPFG